MKKLLLVLTICFFSLSLLSQSCLPEGITFTTQEQIDNFQTDFPDCTTIDGDVWINDYGEITNLNGLNVLTSIEGNLLINSSSLLNLFGLDNLLIIGGNLAITQNDSLENFAGLESLITIGGSLIIGRQWEENPKLTTLNGLDNLLFIGGGLYIQLNSILYDISSLNGLAYIGGNLTIVGNLLLNECQIQSLCSYLSSPNGIVRIYGNAEGCNDPSDIANACGFSIPCLPYGNYYFRNQMQIDNFQVNYPGCSELEGEVHIRGADILNLNGLNSVTGINGNLIIMDNDSLSGLIGLENISLIEGYFWLGHIGEQAYGNPTITNLTGLGNLSYIGSDLVIEHNDSLINLDGLNSLDSIGGSLLIAGNRSLVNLEGLENLSKVDNSIAIGGTMSIYKNPELNNLSGLEGLNTIGGGLRINAHESLISISALSNLTSIGGYLEFRGNDNLISLNGIDNIAANSINSLHILYNNILSECEVQSICDYLATTNGYIDIRNNAPGCNSVDEIEEACETVSVNEIGIIGNITISPNPFSTSTTLSYELQQPEKVSLSIYNHLGQIVYQTQENQPKGKHSLIWDAERYAEGVYYYRLKVGDNAANGKMVKVR